MAGESEQVGDEKRIRERREQKGRITRGLCHCDGTATGRGRRGGGGRLRLPLMPQGHHVARFR